MCRILGFLVVVAMAAGLVEDHAVATDSNVRQDGNNAIVTGRQQPASGEATVEAASLGLLTKHSWAVVGSDGKVTRGNGVVTAKRALVGGYEVTFDRDVSSGAFVACVGSTDDSPAPRGFASVARRAAKPNTIWVDTIDPQGQYQDISFHLIVMWK